MLGGIKKENYNYLRVKKQDWEQYLSLLSEIKSHIRKNKPVPKKLFSEYESIIESVKTDNYAYYIPKQKVICSTIIKYFEKYPAYHFTTNHKGICIEYAGFEDMISTVTLMISMSMSHNIGNTYKDNILKNRLNYIILFIGGYCKEYSHQYSDRQTYIMAGRIVLEYDYPIIGGKELTNPNLFYAVRNAIKYKNKKAQE